MAKKPTISEVAKRICLEEESKPELKSLWFRELKKANPELAASILKYIHQWLFEKDSEAKADCETKNHLRRAVQTTLDEHGLNVTVEKTSFANFTQKLERAHAKHK